MLALLAPKLTKLALTLLVPSTKSRVGVPVTCTGLLILTCTCRLSPALKRLSALSPSTLTLCTVGGAVSYCKTGKLPRVVPALPAASLQLPRLRLSAPLAPTGGVQVAVNSVALPATALKADSVPTLAVRVGGLAPSLKLSVSRATAPALIWLASLVSAAVGAVWSTTRLKLWLLALPAKSRALTCTV